MQHINAFIPPKSWFEFVWSVVSFVVSLDIRGCEISQVDVILYCFNAIEAIEPEGR